MSRAALVGASASPVEQLTTLDTHTTHIKPTLDTSRLCRYPNDSANGALRALFTNHLAPLAHAHFGSDIIDAHAAGDAGSVVSGGTSRPGSARVTGLCLTPKGTLSLAAVGEGTPSVPMLVTTAPHVGPVPGSSVPLANPGGTTLPRRTMSVRLASGAATPDNGSVVCE